MVRNRWSNREPRTANREPTAAWLAWLRLVIVVIVSLGLSLGVAFACRHPLTDRAEAAALVAARHPQVPRLSTQALAELPANGLLLVDVRPKAEWTVSHLPGAFRSEDPDSVVAEAARRHLKRIVVYCSIGERSCRLAERVQQSAPALHISNLSGGIFTWAAEDRPLVDDLGQPTRLVHPYDDAWGQLLPADRRAPVP